MFAGTCSAAKTDRSYCRTLRLCAAQCCKRKISRYMTVSACSSPHTTCDDVQRTNSHIWWTRLLEEASLEHVLSHSQLKDGVPQFAEDRRRDWLALPSETRASIRHLHTMVGHEPKAVTVHIMQEAAVNPEIVKRVKFLGCDHCHENTSVASVPPVNSFNYEIILDS